jgi:hypothetical protein
MVLSLLCANTEKSMRVMVNVRNLKKPVNRKGSPPPQNAASQNLVKPASGEKVPLQLLWQVSKNSDSHHRGAV